MPETLQISRHEAADGLSHPGWHMHVKSGTPESLLNAGDVWYRTRDRLVVLDEDDEVPEGVPVFDFKYDENQFSNLLTHPRDGYYENVPLGKFVRTHPWELATRGKPKERDVILANITHEYIEAHPPASWWLNLDAVRDDFRKPIMAESVQPPTEQFIIGQEGRGVRFWNYGEQMSPGRVADCRRFVDIMTQFFGEHVYDILTDVVVAPINHELLVKKDEDASGFVNSALPKVAFIDSTPLSRNDPYPGEDDTLKGSKVSLFLNVLTHEFGHLLHGLDPTDLESLITFAKSIGWKTEQMQKQLGDKWSEYRDLRPFSPTTVHTLSREYDPKVPIGDQSVARYGSPTSYGRKHPFESSAETTAYATLGNLAMYMPVTRDAWLEHAEQRSGQPIATLLDRAPIVVDRRTGADILYPRTPLPEKIYVRAKVRKLVAA
jgi:hypothetical protein